MLWHGDGLAGRDHRIVDEDRTIVEDKDRIGYGVDQVKLAYQCSMHLKVIYNPILSSTYFGNNT